MIAAILFNITIVLWATYFRYRDDIIEAGRERKTKKEYDKMVKKIDDLLPKNYTNRRGTRGAIHHADGRWEYTRVGTNPPPTFARPNPPPNPPPPPPPPNRFIK